MKNARIGAIPKGKGNGRGKSASSKGMHKAAKTYTSRARATSKFTDNS